jgi:hypothetical protein
MEFKELDDMPLNSFLIFITLLVGLGSFWMDTTFLM